MNRARKPCKQMLTLIRVCFKIGETTRKNIKSSDFFFQILKLQKTVNSETVKNNRHLTPMNSARKPCETNADIDLGTIQKQ